MGETNGGALHSQVLWVPTDHDGPPESAATGSPLETDAELLARAVLAGDIRAAYPLADEVIARAQEPDGFVPRVRLTELLTNLCNRVGDLEERVVRLEQGPQPHYYLGKRCQVAFGNPYRLRPVEKEGRVDHVLADGRFAVLSNDGEVGYFMGHEITLLP